GRTLTGWAQASDPIVAGRPLVRYPQKTDLILLTSRPPQLETPMKWFDRAITPNEAFFVRYHVFPIPTRVDLATWRLRIGGVVDRPLELSMDDLKAKFPAVAVTAVNQCSGNSRGRFTPRVLGGQWGDGAMGNAEWAGARLRDILTAAGVRQGAVQATFDGLDKPSFPSVPDFVKSLDVTRIMDDPDVLVAVPRRSRASRGACRQRDRRVTGSPAALESGGLPAQRDRARRPGRGIDEEDRDAPRVRPRSRRVRARRLRRRGGRPNDRAA